MGGLRPPRKKKTGKSKSRKPGSPSSSPSPSSTSSSSSSSMEKGTYRRGIGLIGRLLAWYMLYTLLFRCPATSSSSSPTICHGYNTLQDFMGPHLHPYLDNYLQSPYITRITPYVNHANEAYVFPFLKATSAGYEKYAEPSILRGKAAAEQEYRRRLQPHVSRVTAQLNAVYEQNLAVYWHKLRKIYQDVTSSPHWTAARDHAAGFYKNYLVPGYRRLVPYFHRASENVRYVAVVVLGPYVKEGTRVSGEWLEKNVWSGVRGIWKEYVQVQMGRIRDRLASVHVGSGFENPDHSLRGPNKSPDTASPPVPSEDPDENLGSSQDESAERKAAREAARKQIEEDLATYTEKFEKHAAEAIISLNAHVDEIATAAMKAKKPEVEAQLRKLDDSIEAETQVLKTTIINLSKHYTPGTTEEERQKNKLETFDQLFHVTKKVTMHLKTLVESTRWDTQRFLASVYDEVAAAADTHVEKVDILIDSGIQELGMKWAWQIDGVTYKDWARYQDLKKEFSGIRTKVIKAAEGNQKLLEVTQWAEGESWEAGAYNRAKAATAELARLKRIGKKKIELNDYSEDFSDKYLTQAAVKPDQQGLSPQREEPKASDSVPEEYPQNMQAPEQNIVDVVAKAEAIISQKAPKREERDPISGGETRNIPMEPADSNPIAPVLAQGGDVPENSGLKEIEKSSTDADVPEIQAASSTQGSSRLSTPLPTLEVIINSANEQLQRIVGAATGSADPTAFESAISKMSGIIGSASADISIAIYGPASAYTETPGTAEAAATTGGSGAAHGGRAEEQYYAGMLQSAQIRLMHTLSSASLKLSAVYEESKATTMPVEVSVEPTGIATSAAAVAEHAEQQQQQQQQEQQGPEEAAVKEQGESESENEILRDEL